MKQVASLRYDVIFKKAFSHPELFTALVKDFLDIEIDEDKKNRIIYKEKRKMCCSSLMYYIVNIITISMIYALTDDKKFTNVSESTF